MLHLTPQEDTLPHFAFPYFKHDLYTYKERR
jgi:hypothetical protein